MGYPSLEQYNQALQHPALCLEDAELKNGKITLTQLGLPLALCGGFALTYTITCGPKTYAVRCFHRQSRELEARYRAITNRLTSINSPYFLNFTFQPKGVRIDGSGYPVVKMMWASGETLGEFLDDNYRNKSALILLTESLRNLSVFLESQQIAHGDIQPGNVMVSNGGRTVQLIDYDGMFVQELQSIGSSELGHRNFQHPQRSQDSWDARLDRFSFIALDLSLRALQSRPDLWSKTQSDGESVLFKANDFADPDSSPVFADLLSIPEFRDDTKNLLTICKAKYTDTPTLNDYIARRNIPQIAIARSPVPQVGRRYTSQYPVLNAADYLACVKHVGDRIELIGKIVEVHWGETRGKRKDYVFINFGNWRGQIVKISIWPKILKSIESRPDPSWVGKWISVVGLLEPPYRSPKFNYSHLSISITQSNQIHLISDIEANFRLSGLGQKTPIDNQKIIQAVRGKTPGGITQASPTSKTPNQTVIQGMKRAQSTAGTPTQIPPATPSPPQSESTIERFFRWLFG